jgi:hypothetical protein
MSAKCIPYSAISYGTRVALIAVIVWWFFSLSDGLDVAEVDISKRGNGIVAAACKGNEIK